MTVVRRLRDHVRLAWIALFVTLWPIAAAAHPVPFSYVDLRLGNPSTQVTLVVHMFDVAHDLGVEPVERLLDPEFLTSRTDEIARLLSPRLAFEGPGGALRATWSRAEPLADRSSLRFVVTLDTPGGLGTVNVNALIFPYDPEHRTFLNVYENDELTAQEILGVDRPAFEYFSGTRQGVLAVIQRFVPSGVHHILIGPDHLLFLIGLLLTGGALRQMVLMVTAFTVAHSVTLSVAALGWYVPPAAVIEPAIALSIVYVGIDNLLKRDGRDMRMWIAFAFGFIHGFGFANVLREMDLPARALGWSLFSFNIGVEIGQLAVVAAAATVIMALRARSERASWWLTWVGSIVVIAAGSAWFVERTFFPGG